MTTNVTDPACAVVASPPRPEFLPSFLAVLEVWRRWHEGERAYQAARTAAGRRLALDGGTG